jgi:hypothetical protein
MATPAAPTPKVELLNQAAVEYNGFEQAIHGLNEDHLLEVWLGTWSVRDILAHLSGWHREMAPALERLTRGERPVPAGVSYDDVDAWNARFVAAKRDWPLAEILLELDRSHEAFMHAAAGVPEERIRPGSTAYRIIDACTASHYQEHGDQIRAWRASRGL